MPIDSIYRKQYIATLDNNIARLKDAMFKGAVDIDPPHWAAILDKVVVVINKSPTAPLMHSAPEDVEHNEVLHVARKKQGAIDMETNRIITRNRVNNVMDKGAFRYELKAHIFSICFKPRWREHIETARDIKGGRVIAYSGKQYPLKYVQPVSSTSTRAKAQAITEGSDHISERARREMEPFARRIHAHFAGQDITFRDAGAFISTLRGFRAATLRAKIKQRNSISKVLRHFPELFRITSTTGRGSVPVQA